MAKDARIAIRLDTSAKEALEKAAADDKRSLSSLLAKIVDDWIKGQKVTSRRMDKSG